MASFNPFTFRPWPVLFWTTLTYIAIVIPLLYVHETVPAVPKEKALPAGVNLTDSWIDLQRITAHFHPYNSHANDEVRQYLIRRSKQILDQNKIPYTTDESGGRIWSAQGRAEADTPHATTDDKPRGVTLFDDQISNATFITENTVKGLDVGAQSGQYFEGTNFYAYIHGKEDPDGEWWTSANAAERFRGTGGVLVNCHYDSVATAYGATDDGVSCITLLQLLSHFTTEGQQPKHGIVLLFNNAEEDGLLGAIAFGYSPLRQFCHTFVNLEGAGAGGRAMLFRTTDLEVAKAYGSSPYPFGSVIAADAFSAGLIHSGTDYQIFADHFGQRGIDIAFYEPRARYHTEDDDARHTSVQSIWHMLSAAVSTTRKLSESTDFNGHRSDGRQDLVQNGKQTRGVWFDFFGSSWAAFALRGLFAWTLTLLIATPLILFVVTVLLIKHDKYYFFASSTEVDSGVSDGLLSLHGWRGLFRFPFALVFACALTFGSVRLVGKINPLIMYSNSYAVWAMSLSIFYSSFWLIMRGSSYVRPSALHRGYSLMWLFAITWAFQIFVAVCEDRFNIGAFYFAAFFHTSVFLALLISLVELFALPSKSDFAKQMQDADPPNNLSSNGDENEGEENQEDQEEEEATETTPLRAGEEGYGATEGDDQPTFTTTYRRRSAATADQNRSKKSPRHAPYGNEQSWSGRLPSWTWFIQLLVLAPIHLIIMGNTALVQTAAMAQTSVDGSNMLTPLLAVALLTVILLFPLTPFIHRVRHHLPTFLFLAFVGTLIYNLVAFPFSANYRFKYFFQQTIDVDQNTNQVSVYGIPEYTRQIIASLPGSAGQSVECRDSHSRVAVCEYDSSSLPPNLVPGAKLKDLVTITASKSSDGKSVNLQLDAVDTRTCTISFSSPVIGFAVENAAPIEKKPVGGVTNVRLWRRKWEGPWNVTLQLGNNGAIASQSTEEETNTAVHGELKVRDVTFEVTASCSWSDANVATSIPAFTEFKRYAPRWSVVSKSSVGLVEVKKTVKV